MHSQQICPTKHVKGSSSGRRQMITKENQDLYKELNSAGHGKVVGEYKVSFLHLISLEDNDQK